MSLLSSTKNRNGQKSVLPIMLAAGCGSFIVGIGLTIGYMQWQDQKAQLERITLMLEDFQQGNSASAPEIVSRNAPLSVLSNDVAAPAVTAQQAVILQGLVNATAPAPQTAAPQIAVPAVIPQEEVPQAAVPVAAAPSTADRINALISRSADPFVSAAIAQGDARRELMSVAIHGVNELAAAATQGNYTLDVDGLSADGTSGNLRISFPQNAEDQAELERLLSSAAEAGMIAFNASVRGSDGTYDGHLILFDLLERSLSNGTEQERATSELIRQQAVTLLSTNEAVAIAAPANQAGERYYTVESGDSLAFISLQFYGRTNDYLKIFEANKNKLSSPEKIQIGQRLLIPAA